MTLRELQDKIRDLPTFTPGISTEELDKNLETMQAMLDKLNVIKAQELDEALSKSGKLHGLEALDLMMMHDVIICHPTWTGDSYWTRAPFGLFVSHGYKAHIAGKGCPTLLALDYIMSDGWTIHERKG